MTSRTVLVTGANGFIGSHVVDALQRAEGFRVVLGVRASARVPAPSPPHERRVFDLESLDSLVEAMRGCDGVINCAMLPAGPEAARDSMTRLLTAAETAGVQRLTHMSSVAVYGGATGVIRETTPPVEPLSDYGRDKAAGEAVCASHASDALRIVVLRPSLVYGRNGADWTEYFLRGARSGGLKRLSRNGDGVANLVYVKDLAAFCVTLSRQDLPVHTVLNVNGDDRPTFNAYFNMLSQAACGRDLAPWDVGPRTWKLRQLGLKVVRKLASLSPLGKRLDFSGVMFIDDDYNKYSGDYLFSNDAARQLGFRSRYSVKAGIDDMLAG